MFDQMTPANWFWILMALMLTCYMRVATLKSQPPMPTISAASVISLFNF